MEKSLTTQWQLHVFPHGPLRQITSTVWIVTGSMPRGGIPRNMVIHKLSDGTLLLHSAVALNEEGMAELEKLGKPSILVVPNPIHRSDAAVYKERYPDIQVVCPSSAREKVEQVVKVDAVAQVYLPPRGVLFIKPPGLKPFELAYVFKTPEGRVLVVTDCLMNLPRFPGFVGSVFYWIGSSGFFGITFIGRLLLLRERKLFANWLSELAAMPDLQAICMAHGEPIVERCGEALLAARGRLGKA